MYFLTITLFLSLFLMTQASDLSSELNQPSLSESVYIFHVKSDAPIAEIKGSFSATGGPRHSFRIIGENTYCFVMASNDTTALRQLTFPQGSSVTQFPVVHTDEYYKMFGVMTGNEENDTEETLPDIVLTYVEWEYDFPKGIPVALFNLMMKSVSDELMVSHRLVRPLIYFPVAYYPTKLIAFVNIQDNANQYIIKNVQDVFGGIGILVSKTKHMVKI